MTRTRKAARWLDDRLHLSALFASTAGHKIPASSASWFYVFGSATLVCFIIQIITGACLAFVYVPSTNEAWTSLNYLSHAQFLGWYLRALHYWASNFMVAVVTAHMIQVFLFGAYKYPRELTWVSGVFLMLFTLGMAFTGQVLRFDQDAYWGLGIGASVAGRTPWIGGSLVQLILGAAYRHSGMGVEPHIVGACVVTLLVAWLGTRIARKFSQQPALLKPVLLLGALVMLQLSLGMGAYLVKMADRNAPQPMPPVVNMTTAHVAVGALVLLTSLYLTYQTYRFLSASSEAVKVASAPHGAAI